MANKLYILMRNDMPSLSAGKACAQAAHAANDFQANYPVEYEKWKAADRTFGTTIVLSASKKDMETFLKYTYPEYIKTGNVVDPTYPVKDGVETHTSECWTCTWAYVENDLPDWILYYPYKYENVGSFSGKTWLNTDLKADAYTAQLILENYFKLMK